MDILWLPSTLLEPMNYLVRAALSHGSRRVFTQKAGRGPPQKGRNELQKSQEKKRLFMVFCTVREPHRHVAARNRFAFYFSYLFFLIRQKK